MSEVIRIDDMDIPLTHDAIKALFLERKHKIQELSGRLDAIGLELEKEKSARAALEDPKAIEAKVQNRLKIVEKCRRILGDDISLSDKTDEELKALVIKKFYPELDISAKDQSYTDGMFEAISGKEAVKNDSLSETRQAIHSNSKSSNNAYEKWLMHSAKMWTLPLSGHARGGN